MCDIISYKSNEENIKNKRIDKVTFLSFLSENETSDEDNFKHESEEKEYFSHPNSTIEEIETFCWNTPRPTTPLSPKAMAFCFSLSLADGCFSCDPDVIADTFMSRSTSSYHTKKIQEFIDKWDEITGGNLQIGQNRTGLIRSRLEEATKGLNKKLSFLKYIGEMKQTFFLPSISFDPRKGNILHIEFSPERFYYGRRFKLSTNEEPYSMIVICDEEILENTIKRMIGIWDNNELEIEANEFNKYFFLMDCACIQEEKISINGKELIIGEKTEIPSTEQFYSYKTEIDLHDINGFFSPFFQYQIAMRRGWIKKQRKMKEKNQKISPIPRVIRDFWEVIRQSAIGGFD
ncbi:hypothetical protein TRFO_22977 [Tritrichomonas foetus]|uniref:Uncharacterized protein n=1 Tax=Tritrichomonas foetus TaxID=1144522 RepID=A0A1J4KAM1_9EUKA|nr:hypothetical protein TRFO_22969 [Tritrichomonas foetus]OHT08473.1 hypothetical protein TRFO_22977 [Tritrichomonas foetus]|eukprot:OHT08468.1 hypothetical protein TRFO_22969 [Tritrichomonas foetus]